nr:MAG TPA: hypothetical protein [Caudoviricetes sp.]
MSKSESFFDLFSITCIIKNVNIYFIKILIF